MIPNRPCVNRSMTGKQNKELCATGTKCEGARVSSSVPIVRREGRQLDCRGVSCQTRGNPCARGSVRFLGPRVAVLVDAHFRQISERRTRHWQLLILHVVAVIIETPRNSELCLSDLSVTLCLV